MKLLILAVTVMCINGCITIQNPDNQQQLLSRIMDKIIIIDSLQRELRDCKEQSARTYIPFPNYIPYHLDSSIVYPRGRGIIRIVPFISKDSIYAIPNFDHK